MPRAPTSRLALAGLRVEIPRTLALAIPLAADLTGRGSPRGFPRGVTAVSQLPRPTPAPGPTIPPGPAPTPAPGPPQAPVRGLPRTVNFHFTEDTSGGAATSELRAYGPIPNPFRITELLLIAPAGAVQGQYIDVLISADTSAADTATPTGTSIFPLVLSPTALTAPDAQEGLPATAAPLRLTDLHTVWEPGRTIKVRSFYVSPAVALPDLHVIMTIAEHAEEPNLGPPLPPIGQPPAPAPAPAIPIISNVRWDRIQDTRTRRLGPWTYGRDLTGTYWPHTAPAEVTGYSYRDLVAFSAAIADGSATETDWPPPAPLPATIAMGGWYTTPIA